MFSVRDIVVSAPGWTKGVFVILAVDPSRPKNLYSGQNVLTGKKYRLSPESLSPGRIGVADDAAGAPPVTTVLDERAVEQGRRRAQREAVLALTNRSRDQWSLLSQLLPGDKVKVLWRMKE